LTFGKIAASIAGLAIGSVAFAADPVRAYIAPDGSIRLWLREAPSVAAVDQAGWVLAPKAAETNATWLRRLKAMYGDGASSPWKSLLEDVKSGAAREGVERIDASGRLKIGSVQDDRLTVSASGTAGTLEVPFRQAGGMWNSGSVTKLDAWLAKAAPGAKTLPPLFRFAAKNPGANATSAAGWSALLDASLHASSVRPLVLEGNRPVVLEVVPPPAPPKPAPTGESTPPAGDKAAPGKEPPSPGASFPWVPIALAGLVGVGLGYAGRSLQRTPKAAPPDDTALKQRLGDSVARAERLAADLERSQAAHQETTRAARQFRDEHGTWYRDKEELVRSLDEQRKAHGVAATRVAELAGLLKAAEDAKNRTEGEMGRQIQALQGKVQGHENRAAALATKARAYAGLHREVMDAFNFLQGEIGRPEVAAVVGYLLNYSVANLMDTLLAPNPALERAMLSNVARIAGCVSNLPHVRKAAATADGLLKGLGAGPIPEATEPHPYAGHIGGLLRIARNQLNVELAPFYVAVDGEGKAHAVYI
jgi:hypothetical protein